MIHRFHVLVIVPLMFLVASADAQPPRQRGPFGRRGPVSGLTYLTSLPEVQKEIGVSSEQAKLIDALLDDLREQRSVFRRGFGRSSEDEEPGQDNRSRFQELYENGEKLLATIFETEQAARLNQLRIQYEGVRALDRSEVAQALALSQTQRQAIQEIRQSGAQSYGDQAARERVQTDMIAVFSGDQKEKWEELTGAAFKFPERRRRSRWRGDRPQRPQRPE